ncbi:3D domain-containing protein [Lentibacillus sp. N15]|uniref:3D domain-containing protein n=1 Tax=Lentibacillus songyuanensis TaxID=3136161 RepID=UPI0031BA6841
MKKMKFLRRTGMFLLFLGAFYTTLTSISNVTLTDVKAWVVQQEPASGSMSNGELGQNQVTLQEKSLNHENESKRYISSEEIEGPKTIEEVMNMEQYPTATVLATGYTAGMESTGKSPDHPGYGITYSGVKVQRDLYSTIAADLNVYPVGTIMYIPDYGYGVVADKGAAINGHEIDLYYPTVDDVYNKWGKKEVEVYIVKMGDGTLSEEQFKEWNEDEALQVFREQIN